MFKAEVGVRMEELMLQLENQAARALLGGRQEFANVRFGTIDYPSFGAGLYRCDKI